MCGGSFCGVVSNKGFFTSSSGGHNTGRRRGYFGSVDPVCSAVDDSDQQLLIRNKYPAGTCILTSYLSSCILTSISSYLIRVPQSFSGPGENLF